MGSVRRAVALAAIMLGATALAAQAVSPGVLRIQLTGVIDQVNAAYIEEALATAQTAGYQAALIEIDTPGGELSSMDRIVKAILASEVPVITYVAPEGAQAASAGAFVRMAGGAAGGTPPNPGPQRSPIRLARSCPSWPAITAGTRTGRSARSVRPRARRRA